jgi:hypothetical protein
MNSPDLPYPVEPPTSHESVSLVERLLRHLGNGSFTVSMSAWPYLHYRSSASLQPGTHDSNAPRP